jgi:hypothetical protein
LSNTSAPLSVRFRIILIGLFCLLSPFLSCDNKQKRDEKPPQVKKVVKSKALQYELDNFIDYNDSLSLKPNVSEVESYMIQFDKTNSKDRITISANFNFYNSETMVGYFEYRDKYISIYNYKTKKDWEFIDYNFLKKKTIPSLVDYSSPDADIPPHDPYLIWFEVEEGGKLIKIKDTR